ncbi:virginiamycin B lyase family protein [Flindersiella endophytica]
MGCAASLSSATFGAAQAQALGAITEYRVGTGADHPEGITYGPDGNIWVSHRDGNRISKVTPQGDVTHFALPHDGEPARIVAGPDGALWFTEYSGNRIGRITVDGKISEYTLATKDARPLGITRQGDRYLWFAESKAGKIGRIDLSPPADSKPSHPGLNITEYTVGTGSVPTEVSAGSDGRIWFTLQGRNKIGRFVDGKLEEIRIPTQQSGVSGIAPAPGPGALWFTESSADRLGKVTVDSPPAITEYAVRPSAGLNRVGPVGIAAGADGAVWSTAQHDNSILRSTADGSTIQRFQVPTSASAPQAIALGPGKDMWFTERSTGKVGRIAAGQSGLGISGMSLSVGPASAASGHEKTRTQDLPANALADTAQLQSSPWRSVPWRSVPMGSTPWRSVPLTDIPWRSVDVDPIALSALPLQGTTWESVLAGTIYEGVPLQTVTIDDVLALDPLPAAVQDLTMANIDLDWSPWRSVSLSGLVLANVPLDNLPPPSPSWCAFLAGQPENCSTGVDPVTTTLLDLELAGDDLSGYYADQIDLAAVDFAGTNAPITAFLLDDILLEQTPLGPLQTSAFPSLVTCAPATCPTLADAQDANALAGGATVGDFLDLLPAGGLTQLGLGELLAGIVDGTEIAYEDAPLSTVLDHALIRESDLLEYRIGFTVDCDEAAGLEVGLSLAERFRPLPGSARIDFGETEYDLPDPEVDGSTLRFSPAVGDEGICEDAAPGESRTQDLVVGVEPGATLGTYQASASASTLLDRSAGQEATAGPAAPATADDSHDPAADAESAQPLALDELTAGHIASSGDADLYSLDAPEPGSTLRISLSHLPADYDLVVYGPSAAIPSTPWRSVPWRSVPWRSVPVEDNSEQAATDDSDLAPNGLADVPLLDEPLRATSIRRGTATESVSIPVLDSDLDGRFLIQVSGYNGVSHADPYILRASATPPPAPLECRDRDLGTGTPGTFPALPLPTTTKTLILVDQERMGQLYGASQAAAMMTKLSAYASRSDVAGVVVPVESDPNADVRDMTDVWDGDPCSTAKANAVVGEINKVVDNVRPGLTGLRSIVLVGPDEALPMGRVPDLVTGANEREYTEAAIGGMDTAVSRALESGMILSDDPYGDFDPQVWLNGSLYVPDVALGRLVETPDDIEAQLDQYTSADGVLAPDTADVFGYDFLSDGATAIGQALSSQVPSTTNNGPWDSGNALDAINQPDPAYLAVNAHHNHYGALPEQAFTSGGPDVLYSTDVAPAAGSVLFTVGCHAGLNVPNVAVSSPTPEEQDQLTDWAEQSSKHSALFTGNTGYGYGDTEVVGYSERLLQHYAEQLSGTQVTAGQALMFAKQQYAGDLGVIGVYDSKVLQESVFYGLPTYRVTEDGGEGAATAAASKPAAKAQAAEDPRLRSARFSADPQLQEVRTERGSYWTVPGQFPQTTHFRPIEPRTRLNVTAEDGARVHGALIEELASTDRQGVDPVYSRPTIDLTSNEPERSADAGTFPTQIQSVNMAKTPRGQQDWLVLITGQTVSGAEGARQRLFSHVAGTVYRSDSDDWAPPRVTRTDGFVVGRTAVVSVSTPDADVARGVVMYRDDAGSEWRRAEMQQTADGQWSAGIPLRPGATTLTEFFVQLADGAGNVGVSTNKGGQFTTESTEPGGEGIGFELTPAPPDGGFYRDSPRITIAGLDKGEGAQVTVDGGRPFRYDGPFTVKGDGVHVIRARTDSGKSAIIYVAIDTTPPTITGSAAPAANDSGWRKPPVTVTWTCADGLAGVTSCPEPTVLQSDGAGQSASASVTDKAGNTAKATVDGINIDGTPPAITGSATPEANEAGWRKSPVTVTWTCSDSLSGVASCPEPTVLQSDGAGQSASASVTDKAGNTAKATVDGINIDGTPPDTKVNNALILAAGRPLTGSASDGLSGVSKLTVQYRPIVLGAPATVSATLTCDQARRSCTWSAPAPTTLGLYSVTATATDAAGNPDPTPASVLLTISIPG